VGLADWCHVDGPGWEERVAGERSPRSSNDIFPIPWFVAWPLLVGLPHIYFRHLFYYLIVVGKILGKFGSYSY